MGRAGGLAARRGRARGGGGARGPGGGGAGGVTLLWTALLLGFRHGFDWDHIAAISDVTSTTATADVAEVVHARSHDEGAPVSVHGHGGRDEVRVHAATGHPHAHIGSRAGDPRAEP